MKIEAEELTKYMEIRNKQMKKEDNLQRNAVKTRNSDFRSRNVEYNNLPNE